MIFLDERLRGRRKAFQRLAHLLSTGVREAVFCKLSPRGLGREEGRHEINLVVEEELLEMTQFGIRAQWFSTCFPLSIPLNDSFANISLQRALWCSPEIALPKWQAQYHIPSDDIP